MSQFIPTPRNQQGLRIAQFLPTGKAWDAATDGNTNMGKLLRGLGIEFYRLELLLETVNREGDINRTVKLIREWETAVGIPDDCFEDITDTSKEGLEIRRNQVLVKLRNIRIQTTQDYIDLAAEFGEVIEVTPAIELAIFPLTFPITFSSSVKAAKFTIIVDFDSQEINTFPLMFPLPFGSNAEGIVQCLLKKIKPANCNIIFRYGQI